MTPHRPTTAFTTHGRRLGPHQLETHLAAAVVRPELRRPVGLLVVGLPMLAAREPARLDQTVTMKEQDWDFAGADRTFAAVFRAYRVDVEALELGEAAPSDRGVKKFCHWRVRFAPRPCLV